MKDQLTEKEQFLATIMLKGAEITIRRQKEDIAVLKAENAYLNSRIEALTK